MSVYPITTSLKVVKPPQWVKETTGKGTTPTSPSFSMLPAQEFSPIIRAENIKYRRLGNADLTRDIALPTDYSFSIAYAPVDATLLEAMIALVTEGVTYDREDSFTFLMSQQHNNAGTLTEMYQIAKGCSIESVTITIDDASPILIESQWSALTIGDWSTTHNLTAPTFASEITQDPWSAITTGSNPLTFDSESYDIRHFSCTIDHNPQRFYVIASSQPEIDTKRIELNARDITLEMDIVFKDTVISENVKTFLPKQMQVQLNFNPATFQTSILTFDDVYLEAYDETVDAQSTEAKIISYTGTASSVLLTQEFLTIPVISTSTHVYHLGLLTATQTSIQKYNLLQYITPTSIQKYDLLQFVANTSRHKYDITLTNPVSRTSIQKYNILTSIINTLIQKYNIAGTTTPVSQTSIHKYNLLVSILQNSIHKYNLFKNIAQTSVHKYNIEVTPVGPTRLYFHSSTDSTSGLPTAEQSSLTVTSGCEFEGSQTTNRSMNTTKGTSQTSLSFTGALSTSARNYYVTRFVSAPLNQSSISANTWTYAFTALESATSGNFPVSSTDKPVHVNCYVWRPSNGTKVGTILDGNSASTVDEGSPTNQIWHIVNFTGSAVASIQSGDVIIFEAWFVVTSSSTTSQTLTFYYDGTDDTYTENATSTSAASYIQTPEGLTFL